MKQGLQNLVDAVDKAITYFPKMITTDQLPNANIPSDIPMAVMKAAGGAMSLTDLHTSMKHLDQFLNKKFHNSTDEKEGILSINNDLKSNLDEYSTKLDNDGKMTASTIKGKISLATLINDTIQSALNTANHIVKIQSK